MNTPRKKLATIDWQAVRDRLARITTAFASEQQLSPERIQAILQERARAAARVPTQAPEVGAVIEVVRFFLGAESYAVETTCVREILRLGELTSVPDAPDFLVGVINLRGQIVAVMDLRRFFGITPQPDTERSRVIVLGKDRLEFGLVADAVHEIVSLRLDEIREVPGSVAPSARELLRGVTADALLILDGEALLNDSRFYIDLGDDGSRNLTAQ